MNSTAPVMKDDSPSAGSAETKPKARGRDLIGALIIRQEASLVMLIVVIGLAATLRNSSFIEWSNIVEIFKSTAIYAVMACGAGLLIIGGGLDFSVGATFTLAALVGCKLMTVGTPVALAILIGVLAGTAVGVLNHTVIRYLHAPPIIGTLGVYFMVTAIDQDVTGGADVLPLPTSFNDLGQNAVAGIPLIIIYGVVIGAVFWFVLEHTRFGVNVRALGGNRQAAVNNGLRTVRLDLALYTLAALTAAIAGLIYAAQVGAGQVEAGGTTTTLEVFTAVLIGGVSLFGGLGSVSGVLVGAVLLSEIDNALVVARIPPQYNNLVVGAILILAVALDYARRQRLFRKR